MSDEFEYDCSPNVEYIQDIIQYSYTPVYEPVEWGVWRADYHDEGGES